ncbi:N-terminal phage integrase SAM-like domain-containing protein [Seinonella peptonophila]|uniref:N-terminal phage integrase SAM-like domain-containing protein n=1 Tax=Seinonella peptonophila TaxID=112248 RepID=UPI000A00E8C0
MLKEFLKRWLEDYGRNSLKPTSFENYSRLIQVPSLGKYTLQKLQDVHIQRFYNENLENGRIDDTGGLSPQTVRYFHSILREVI